MEPGIQVVICTYNGLSRLTATLNALAEQTLASDRWSVLVVDNASTDGTAELARAAWTRRDVPLCVITEISPGQMRARLRALAEAHREFVCFCDDDNWLAPDYLKLALHIMKNQPGTGALGGSGLAISDAPLPEWFPHAAHGYAIGPQAPVEQDVTLGRGFVYGAGMVLRMTAWHELAARGFTSRLLGREPTKVNSGDDNELCLGLALLGWRIYFSPQLVFRHSLESSRLNEAYSRKLFRSFGEATIVLNAYRDFLIGRATPSAWRLCALQRAGQGWLARLRHKLRPTEGGPLTPQSLQREIAAGFAEGIGRNYSGLRLPKLYAGIATWLTHTDKGST